MSHADHEWAREQLAAHLAGGLPADERARLEAHASTCAECIAELDALRRFDRSMEEMFAPVRPQPGLEERVIRGLRRVPQRQARPPLVRVAYAVAAVFLMGLVGFAVMIHAGEADPLRFGSPPVAVKDLDKVRARMLANSGVQDGEARYSRVTPAPESPPDASLLHLESSKSGRLLSTSELAGAFARDLKAGWRRDPYSKNAEESERNRSADDEDFSRAKGDTLAFSGKRNFSSVGGSVAPEPPRPSSTPPPPPVEGVFALADAPAAGRKDADGGYFRPGDLAMGDKEKSLKITNETREMRRAEEPSKKKPNQSGGLESGQENPPVPQQARKIIRSGEMEFEIESFDSAVAKIDTIAAEEQGVIATVNSEKLPNGKVRGSVVIRVPPDRLSTLIVKLRALGDLKSQRLGSEDITKQYTDLESRLRAARTMEERLIRIIKEGKGEIKDLLLAEKELGEWRTKIEVAEGEKRYYDNLVSLSTLTITLFEKEIRAAFGVTETENVNAGVEVEDVETAHKDLLKSIADAKGRVTKSDLKKLTAGQFSATVHFEVAPEAAGPLRDRLKQLGNVSRLDVNVAQQTEGGRAPTADIKVKRNDTQFFVSIYNLANVSPRETVHLNLACADVETSYLEVFARVEKAAGRIKTSRRDRTSGTLDFEVKSAEAILEDLKAQGEVMTLQVTENSDLANVTRSKKGYVVTLTAIGSTQARETTTIQLAARDVAAAHKALSEAVRKAEGRVYASNLNENDRRNVTASLHFDVRRAAEKGVADEMSKAGEVYSRTSNRLQEGQNMVDSKVRIDLTIFPIANIPPRETLQMAIEVNDVDGTLLELEAIAAAFKGKLRNPVQTTDPSGTRTGHAEIDVPQKDARAAAERLRKLGRVRMTGSRQNPTVPESELAIARFDVTVSNELIVPTDSAPWASIKKGLSVSVLALSWSLTLVMIGVCFVLPLAAIGWGGWKLAKRSKRAPAAV